MESYGVGVVMSRNTFNDNWVKLISKIHEKGSVVKPRGNMTREILNSAIEIDMNYPVLTVKERKLGYKFMVAEAWWILTGRNDVESIAPYSRKIQEFSDDGNFFFGAYGPRIIDQLSYVIDALASDRETRQAVLTIWRSNPRRTKDVPCTISVQWFIRDGKLHCIDNMRSSDVWLGVPYDAFNFSMLSGYIAILLAKREVYVDLGTLYLNAGSHHLYFENWEQSFQISKSHTCYNSPEFNTIIMTPQKLIKYLEAMKDYDALVGKYNPGFLNKLFTEVYESETKHT